MATGSAYKQSLKPKRYPIEYNNKQSGLAVIFSDGRINTINFGYQQDYNRAIVGNSYFPHSLFA